MRASFSNVPIRRDRNSVVSAVLAASRGQIKVKNNSTEDKMSPKPFPYPLAIGIDVCKVGRMYQLMRKGPRMTSFARRVFTRSEFMALRLRFLKMHADDPETKIPEEDPANYENCQWTLPSLKFDEDTRNADPNIFRLAEYLAGRLVRTYSI